MPDPFTLTAAQATQFARLGLRGIEAEFPNKLDHVIGDEAAVRRPRELHPAFFGCFDWHSAVHTHWMLLRLLRLQPGLPEATAIRRALGTHLSPASLRAERAYLEAPGRRAFERPYGWAWLLKLAEESAGGANPPSGAWTRDLQPLADWVVAGYRDFLPRQRYPVRAGTHANTAFGLGFALDYARSRGESAFVDLLVERSLAYFGADVDGPARWEPSGNEFLSPCLVEADLMARVLGAAEFAGWLSRFLPGLAQGQPASLLLPAAVSDRSDPQIVHLDGLNLSRAWCLRRIAAALAPGDPARPVLADGARAHTAAALPHVTSGDYMGEHWLATFAVYLLSAAPAGLV